ncbi:MAG: hypothetical protein HOH43_25420 [Candidatus Latescibacteria bacterium]|nr:hypothetical protein [Candidatus Latescibacterota bacterium]
MAVVCSAPGRAGIIGNPTDMYGGSVISCSLQERARVIIEDWDHLELETEGERRLLKTSNDFSVRGDHFDIARAVLTGTNSQDLSVRISWQTSIPFQAGLSGSTSLLVATLAAVEYYRGISDSRYHLAERARMIEYQHLGVFCGYQDAYMCTFGGMNYMDFRGKEFHQDFGSDPLATVEPLSDYSIAPSLLLVNTAARKVSGKVHRPIRDRWVDGDREVVDAYRNIEEIARAGKRALLNADWEWLGTLMNENHSISSDLGGSNQEDDAIIETARRNGALGAKLAGSGGTVIILHPEVEGLKNTLTDAGARSFMRPAPCPGVVIEEQN